MSKQIYCAQCGMEQQLTIKAIPTEAKTIYLIAPHTCPKESPDFPFKDPSGNLNLHPDPKPILSSAFDKLKFVSKINDLKPSTPINPLLAGEPGDRRPKDQIIDTTAPTGITEALKSKLPSTPERD